MPLLLLNSFKFPPLPQVSGLGRTPVSFAYTTKKIEITDGILPTDIHLSVNLNYRRILPTDSQILITDGKIRR